MNINIDMMRYRIPVLRSVDMSPDDFLQGGAISSFRALAADLLWVKVDAYSHRGQLYKILPLLKSVTTLQPHFILAWTVGGWHMAFNLYHDAKKPEEKKKWLDQGILFLKQGIRKNPDVYRIYFELGWTYFFKVKDYPNTIKYIRRATHFDHPQFVDHLLAHAYERNGQINESLKIWKRLQKRGSSSETMQRVVTRMVNRLEQLQ